MKITLANPPEGYEAQAEYKVARAGEHVLGVNNETFLVKTGNAFNTAIVLTPKKPTHIPYTYDTFRRHRNKWFIRKNDLNEPRRVNSYDTAGVYISNGGAAVYYPWTDFLEHFVLEADNQPAGIEQ